VDFAFDETQREIKQLAAEVLARTAAPSDEETRGDYNEGIWSAMAAAGLLSLAVPEELGGAGLGVLETAIVLAEVGRVAAPVPAVATLALGVLPIALRGTETQQKDLLAEADSGRVFTAALNEPSEPMTRAPRVTATREGPKLLVSGVKTGVPYVESAHRILVSVTIPGENSAVALIDPRTDGVSLHRAPASSGIAQYVVRFEQVAISEADLLGGGADPGILDTVLRCAIIGICATASGSLAGTLDLTSEHLRERTQFGRPLATFQAVAQQIADVYVAARTLDLAVWSAAWRLATGRPVAEDLEVAAFWLAEEVPAAMRTCHHLHGGLGVDVTYPLHRHSALITDLVQSLGGADQSLSRLANEIAS
jgi:alkylation response protein AidB-like acyl-CoA dehydrogenase